MAYKRKISLECCWFGLFFLCYCSSSSYNNSRSSTSFALDLNQAHVIAHEVALILITMFVYIGFMHIWMQAIWFLLDVVGIIRGVVVVVVFVFVLSVRLFFVSIFLIQFHWLAYSSNLYKMYAILFSPCMNELIHSRINRFLLT